MSGRVVFHSALLLAACVLAGSGVAQARILQFAPADRAVSNISGSANGLNDYFNQVALAPVPGEVTKTITLNFGPLHFQEVVKTVPKTCRS